MTKRRRWQIAVAGVFVAYGFSGGCYAERLPAGLTAAERVRMRDALPYSITVVLWDSAETRRHGGQSATAYGTAAYKWLNESGAFSSVHLAATPDSASSLRASSMGLYCNTAAIPILTIISVGIIPTIFTDRTCEGIVFRSAHAPTDSVVVRQDHERTVVMGWLAVPLSLLPGWTRSTSAGRVRDRVHLAILDRRDDLARLTR